MKIAWEHSLVPCLSTKTEVFAIASTIYAKANITFFELAQILFLMFAQIILSIVDIPQNLTLLHLFNTSGLN